MATSYDNPGGKGDRTSTITVTSDAYLYNENSDLQSLVNGVYDNLVIYFEDDNPNPPPMGTDITGEYFKFDFGSPVVIDEAKFIQADSYAPNSEHGTWKWQGSNDNSNWTDIGDSFILGGVESGEYDRVAIQTITTLNGNSVVYRYYRILGISGIANYWPYLEEFEFKIEGDPTPEVYYLRESIQLYSAQGLKTIYKDLVVNNFRFGGFIFNSYSYLMDETINLLDRFAYIETMIEALGISSDEFIVGWAYFIEQLNLLQTSSERMVYSITCNENIAFAESGTVNLALVDYKITWRARTKEPGIGYGKAGYGIAYNYGEGDCIDLKSFKVKVYVMPARTLKRTVTINIIDTQNPDDDAEYSYTSAFNIVDNTTFKSNLSFEVFQIDQNDIESPAASIDVEPILF
jgi:hypothetical protein